MRVARGASASLPGLDIEDLPKLARRRTEILGELWAPCRVRRRPRITLLAALLDRELVVPHALLILPGAQRALGEQGHQLAIRHVILAAQGIGLFVLLGVT